MRVVDRLLRLATLPRLHPHDLDPLLGLCARNHAYDEALRALPRAFPDALDPRRATLHAVLRDASRGVLTRFPHHRALTSPHPLTPLLHTLTADDTCAHVLARHPDEDTLWHLRWRLDSGATLLAEPTALPLETRAFLPDRTALTPSHLLDVDGTSRALPGEATSLRLQPEAALATFMDNTLIWAPLDPGAPLTRFQPPRDLPPGTLHAPALHADLVAAADAQDLHVWHRDTGWPLRRCRRVHMRAAAWLRERRGSSATSRRRRRRPTPALAPGQMVVSGALRYARVAHLLGWDPDTLLVFYDDGRGALLRVDDDTLLAAFDVSAPPVAVCPRPPHDICVVTPSEVHHLRPDGAPATPPRRLPATLDAEAAAASPDGRALLIADVERRELWRAASTAAPFAPARVSHLHVTHPHHLELTPDGALLISADAGGAVLWWSARSGTLLGLARVHRGDLRAPPDIDQTLHLESPSGVPLTLITCALPERSPDAHLARAPELRVEPPGLTLTIAGHRVPLTLVETGFDGFGLAIPSGSQAQAPDLPTPTWLGEVYAACLHPDGDRAFVSAEGGLVGLDLPSLRRAEPGSGGNGL